MIAMALACQPKLIIADEPTTALDVTVQAQILDLLKSLTKELNSALILITHDLGVVARYADNVAVMYAGRIIERASAKNLYKTPLHPYTNGLMSSIPRLSLPPGERLETLQGQPADLTNLPKGCSFHPRCPYSRDICTASKPALEQAETDHGHQIKRAPHTSSIEPTIMRTVPQAVTLVHFCPHTPSSRPCS